MYSVILSEQVRLAQGDQSRNNPARFVGLPDRRKAPSSSIEEEAESGQFRSAHQFVGVSVVATGKR